MNPLDLLKTQLQNALSESTESEDFADALKDGIYSCDWETEAALVQWIESWSQHIVEITRCEKDYQKGVKFVEDKWHQITGMF
jgi:tripartite-type tricarboxylate transporter receptor subunit TctC